MAVRPRSSVRIADILARAARTRHQKMASFRVKGAACRCRELARVKRVFKLASIQPANERAAEGPGWVKLRKSHNEQMSSALDPTTDMAPLGKHLHFEKREGSSRGMFPTPVHSPARHDRVLTVRDEIWERSTVCGTWMAAFQQLEVVSNS